jgi:hypothetical protein
MIHLLIHLAHRRLGRRAPAASNRKVPAAPERSRASYAL